MDTKDAVNTAVLQRVGIQFGLLGMVIWSAALPFGMVQHTRFTAIALWIMLGGYLLALAGRLPFQKIRKSDTWIILTFVAFTLFPLLDFWRWQHTQDALSLVVLRLSMLLIPFLVCQFQNSWPVYWAKMVLGILLISLIINALLTVSAGPSFLFHSIRGGTSIDEFYWMHRPYYGLFFGVFIIGGITLFYRNPKPYALFIFMIFSGLAILFLWLLLVKMALLGIIVVLGLWAFLRTASFFFPTQAKTVLFGAILIMLGIGYKMATRSIALQQVRNQGQIDFATVNKNYANSLNLRLVLWNTAFSSTVESGAGWFGFGTANAQAHLNEAVCKVDQHLCALKLDPHSVWLAEWMQHGLPGLLLVSLLLFVPAWNFERNHFHPYMWIWMFIAFCCLSETYINREMGIQTLVWMAVVIPVFLRNKNLVLPTKFQE